LTARIPDLFEGVPTEVNVTAVQQYFLDQLGMEEKVRQRLAYYPRDVWLSLMLAGWWRVHPEMNHVGRAGYAGDELGSTLIASEIVSGMHLSFLIERRYAP
jgi:hypothetical protein